MSFEKEVWTTFQAIDVKPFMQELKGGIEYISWSVLWGLVMGKYPRSYYEFTEKDVVHVGDDGPEQNVEVWCSLTIVANDDDITSTGTAPKSVTRSMWLPVMQSTVPFHAIANPSAREISDARMRCLVKCAAIHGLGLSAWAGDNYQPDQNIERIVEFAKKKGPNGESPSEYRASLTQIAEVVRNAYDHRDIPDEAEGAISEAVEAYSELSEEEKGDFFIAESKGGFMRNDLKKWFREVGYRKSQEDAE